MFYIKFRDVKHVSTINQTGNKENMKRTNFQGVKMALFVSWLDFDEDMIELKNTFYALVCIMQISNHVQNSAQMDSKYCNQQQNCW